MDENFYILLNSKEGTPSNFITNFSTPFNITNPNEWEVGLKELHFENTIKTIDTDFLSVIQDTPILVTTKRLTFTQHAEGETEESDRFYTYDINNFIIEVGEYFTITLNDNDRIVITSKFKELMTIHFKTTFAVLLGFVENSERNSVKKYYYNIEELPPGGTVVAEWEPQKNSTNDKLLIFPKRGKCTYKISTQLLKRKELVKVVLQPGTYVDSKELEIELNKFADLKNYFTFVYDQHLNRFEIHSTTTDETIKLHLKNGLNDVLGFTEKIISCSK